MHRENEIAAQFGIEVFSPGAEWYAEEILSGMPFTFVRYGEGEWRTVVPKVPHKNFSHPRERTHFKTIWNDPKSGAEEMLRGAVLNHHDHERYWTAMWHFRHLNHYNWLVPIKKWQDKNLGDVTWHDGYVWRRAIEGGRFGPIVHALREQRLPIVVVGPEALAELKDRLPIADHIVIHRWAAYYQMFEIEDAMRAQPPSLFILCGGGPVKIIANKLFPDIGEESTMIDFGASWEGLLGHIARRYFKRIKPGTLRRNWEVQDD